MLHVVSSMTSSEIIVHVISIVVIKSNLGIVGTIPSAIEKSISRITIINRPMVFSQSSFNMEELFVAQFVSLSTFYLYFSRIVIISATIAKETENIPISILSMKSYEIISFFE